MVIWKMSTGNYCCCCCVQKGGKFCIDTKQQNLYHINERNEETFLNNPFFYRKQYETFFMCGLNIIHGFVDVSEKKIFFEKKFILTNFSSSL
jgi:hypothetical protein